MTETVACEVLVVGAGPCGSLAASELRRFGIDVVLLEQRSDAEPGSRAIGVHPPVLAALEASGATERILAEAARIRRGVAYAAVRNRPEAHRLGEVRFSRLRTRFPFVAAVPQAVTEAAVSADGPTPLSGVTVSELQREPGGVRVLAFDETGQQRVWIARTVVVATGSSGRHLLPAQFRRRSRAYPDRYVMTDLAESPDQPADTAVLMLGEHGVAESFPLPGGGRRLVARIAGQRGATIDADLDPAAVLSEAIATRTGNAELAARISHATSFGIRRVLLDRMVLGQRNTHSRLPALPDYAGFVIAIGDAAHEVSPIGGQGMNLGLLDAATLAPVLAGRRAPRTESTQPATLADWQRRRLASAHTAARLASLNTTIGRPWPHLGAQALTTAFDLAMRTPIDRLPERAYAMGFDRDS
ncbi:FAD-dependent oxidoreductase [Leucobacter sp. NPDC058333]|uniref:FAD-dependent oxidoreductase n=1 Tax=Leucobacter sp. NPDC058333 TaxID=3346450 RepID=UPI003653E758